MKIKRKEKQNPFGRGYNPKKVTQNDINEGLNKLFEDSRKNQSQQSMSFNNQFAKPSFQQKKPQQPKLSFTPPQPEPEPEEDAPYWSGEDWEQWAYDMYTQFPATRQFLPQWFIQALEE